MYSIISFFLFILFLIISSVFSISESSIFSLTQTDIDDLNMRKKNRVIFLIRNSSVFLVIILIGNMTANVITASIGSIILNRYFKHTPVIYSIISISLILIILAEIIPKIIALKKPIELSLIISDIFFHPVYFAGLLIEKTGLTNGFSAYIAIIPKYHAGIVILANRSVKNGDIVNTARQILFKLTSIQ